MKRRGNHRFLVVHGRVLGGALLLFVCVAFAAAALFVQSRRREDRAVTAEPEEIHYELNVDAAAHKVLPVYSVERTDRAVALTIDAAWGADKTPEILRILEEHDVKATFFLVGRWVREFPEETKAIVEAGHVIGNHSDGHPEFTKLSDEKMAAELRGLEDAMAPYTEQKIDLIRLPFGDYNDHVIQFLRDASYRPIQWSIDTLDWKEGRTAAQVLEVVNRKAAPGAIILCHNNANTITEYLPILISTLKGQGYTFVTLPELLYDGFEIDVNGMQKAPAG